LIAGLKAFLLVDDDGLNQPRNGVLAGLDIDPQAELPKSRRSHRPDGSKQHAIELL
jgi:hypothetical protein